MTGIVKQTQDPDELAAAVAAGVMVEASYDGISWSLTMCRTADSFRALIRYGWHLRLRLG